MTRQTFRILISLGLIGAFSIPNVTLAVARSADRKSSSAASDPSSAKENYDRRIREIEQSKILNEADKQKIISLYKQAKFYAEKEEQFDEMRASASKHVSDVSAKQKALESEPEFMVPAGASSRTLLKQWNEARAKLTEYTKERTAVETEIARREERRKQVPVQLSEAQTELQQFSRESPPEASLSPEAAEANRASRDARRLFLQNRIESLQKELPAYDAERELLTARRDLGIRRVTRQDRIVKILQEAADQLRREEAKQAAEKASRIMRGVPDILRPWAEENVRLTDRRIGEGGIAERLAQTSQSLELVDEILQTLRANAQTVAEKEKTAGLTEAVSVLLRRYQRKLPNPEAIHRRVRKPHPELYEVELELQELNDRRDRLVNEDMIVQDVLQQAKPSSEKERNELKDTAHRLLKARREYLDELIKDYGNYFEKLATLEARLASLEAETKRLDDYIEERVLWTRSSPPLSMSDLRSARDELKMFFRGTNWRSVGSAIVADAKANPAGIGFWGIFLLCLVAFRRFFNRRLTRTGEALLHREGGNFRQTWSAFFLTLLLAVPVPLLLFVVSRRLENLPEASEFARAVGTGLYPAGVLLLTIGVLIEVCRAGGLAEAHFQWSRQSLALLRKALYLLVAFLIPLVFLTSAAGRQTELFETMSLSRLALMAALAGLAVFNGVLFHPNGKLGRRWYVARTGWLFQLRYIWFALVVVVPILLLGLAWAGYPYLASHLTLRLTASSWLIVGLLICQGLILGWLRVLFYGISLRRRKHQVRSDPESASDENMSSLSEAELSEVKAQSRQVLRYIIVVILVLGLWGIWKDSLPALRRISRIPTWNTTRQVPEHTDQLNGSTPTKTVTETVPVTLGDIALAVVVVILTMIAARSGPGVIRFLMLRRLAIDDGAKYAVTVILRYVIGVVGFVIALGLLGLRWGSIQWLVAAMTVGLGFGLQEIFANFVSGLIILFERPVRLGDTVTIGDTVGTVSRLRIRATTITDWDRKETIVPNKEFITGRLMNWTLSDKVLRLILRVGIAYGSDTELAEQLLLRVAKEHSLVLHDPPPVVVFTEFGDNALQFELRVFFRGVNHYLEVWHGLNMAVDKAFRQAGVTIAFPQRDTHLDTLKPLEVRIVPDDRKPDASSDQ
ncbi:MAG: mechanosensitive ion channel [Phycisphaerae bacterium]|nr:mechanosensitive ion channel [Phycisphaerae bacterium]